MMKKNKKKLKNIFFVFAFLAIFTLSIFPALAQYENQEKIPGSEPTGNFIEYMKQILNFGFAVIGILALFMLVIGAYQYLIGATTGNVSGAKETIGSALLGLILGLCAWVILNTINPDLVSFREITKIQGVDQMNNNSTLTSGNKNNPTNIAGTVPANIKERIAKYDSLVQKYAAQEGVDPNEIRAIIEQESNWRPDAQRSNADFGMMQINRASHPAFFANNNPFDPESNIAYGVKYYASIRKNSDMLTAMARYNNGGKGERTAKGQNYANETSARFYRYANSGYI